MKLHDLTAAPGSVQDRKRIGRGQGSGQGKTAGKDVAADKPTYVSLLGLDQAKALARRCEEQALNALDRIELCGDFEKGTCRRLRELACYVIGRNH